MFEVSHRFIRAYLDTFFETLGKINAFYRPTLTGGVYFAKVRKRTRKVVFAKRCRGGDSWEGGGAVIGRNEGKPPPWLAVELNQTASDQRTISASGN